MEMDRPPAWVKNGKQEIYLEWPKIRSVVISVTDSRNKMLATRVSFLFINDFTVHTGNLQKLHILNWLDWVYWKLKETSASSLEDTSFLIVQLTPVWISTSICYFSSESHS